MAPLRLAVVPGLNALSGGARRSVRLKGCLGGGGLVSRQASWPPREKDERAGGVEIKWSNNTNRLAVSIPRVGQPAVFLKNKYGRKQDANQAHLLMARD